MHGFPVHVQEPSKGYPKRGNFQRNKGRPGFAEGAGGRRRLNLYAMLSRMMTKGSFIGEFFVFSKDFATGSIRAQFLLVLRAYGQRILECFCCGLAGAPAVGDYHGAADCDRGDPAAHSTGGPGPKAQEFGGARKSSPETAASAQAENQNSDAGRECRGELRIEECVIS
jgi:hypothetical protein